MIKLLHKLLMKNGIYFKLFHFKGQHGHLNPFKHIRDLENKIVWYRQNFDYNPDKAKRYGKRQVVIN